MLPSVLARSDMRSYASWMKRPSSLRCGLDDCTMEEAVLDFFYNGVSPWIYDLGYKWNREEAVIARKFVRFCYDIHWALQTPTGELNPPEPQHRNYPEDRETFELFANSSAFSDFLELWKFRDEIVGTRLEFLILEFCYVWVDVSSGKPGSWTQRTIEMQDDNGSEDENDAFNYESYSNRRSHDLY